MGFCCFGGGQEPAMSPTATSSQPIRVSPPAAPAQANQYPSTPPKAQHDRVSKLAHASLDLQKADGDQMLTQSPSVSAPWLKQENSGAAKPFQSDHSNSLDLSTNN